MIHFAMVADDHFLAVCRLALRPATVTPPLKLRTLIRPVWISTVIALDRSMWVCVVVFTGGAIPGGVKRF